MLKIGVPPGVGDVYWCLTKLKAFANGQPVKLIVQATALDRAVAWAEMVDFIDSAEIGVFKCGTARETGVYGRWKQLDAILWPNAVIDRGERIETWLPHLPIDLDFEVKCPEFEPRVIVYASSHGTARNWLQERGGDFWDKVITKISEQLGTTVTVIGAHWDKSLADQISAPCEKLIGQTSLPQLAGILKSARVVCGVISGITILANHFRTPCVAVWSDKRFPPGFPTAWVAANAPYTAVPATQLNATDLARCAVQIAR